MWRCHYRHDDAEPTTPGIITGVKGGAARMKIVDIRGTTVTVPLEAPLLSRLAPFSR